MRSTVISVQIQRWWEGASDTPRLSERHICKPHTLAFCLPEVLTRRASIHAGVGQHRTCVSRGLHPSLFPGSFAFSDVDLHHLPVILRHLNRGDTGRGQPAAPPQSAAEKSPTLKRPALLTENELQNTKVSGRRFGGANCSWLVRWVFPRY